MAVNLPLILFFETKYHLSRDNALVRKFEMEVGIQREGCRVFKEVSSHILAIDRIFHLSAILIQAQRSENV